MTIDAPHLDARVVSAGRTELARLREASSSLVTATLLSDDGFEVVAVPEAPADGRGNTRFASMASSIQALGEAVSRELTMGANGYVIVAGDGGHLVQMRVPGQTVVLAASFDDDEMLGKALTLTRRTAAALSTALEALSAVEATPVFDRSAQTYGQPTAV
jgi:uncharacterized protein